MKEFVAIKIHTFQMHILMLSRLSLNCFSDVHIAFAFENLSIQESMYNFI